MIINELNKLENRIRGGEWQPESDTMLWSGADVIVSYERTDELTAWESDSHLVFDASGLQQSNKVLVISEQAMHISALIFALKDIFVDYIDGANKYEFYGRLGKRAKACIATGDNLDVLLGMIDEARLMAHGVEGIMYFAYGSNMDESQMANRCPNARLVGRARLNGYRFIINHRGVASIVKSDKSFVDGILWSVFPDDVKALDRYEGIAYNFYFKTEITVESPQTGEQGSAIVYIASDNSFGRPRPGYLEKIVSSAERFEFHADYCAELKRWHDATI
jgi:gamma-glutamylcyclotransferase (GGCT)/AIG2-like uncharacterized protein YtfP